MFHLLLGSLLVQLLHLGGGQGTEVRRSLPGVVCEDDLGRPKEEPQLGERGDKRLLSPEQKWGVANVSEETLPGILAVEKCLFRLTTFC